MLVHLRNTFAWGTNEGPDLSDYYLWNEQLTKNRGEEYSNLVISRYSNTTTHIHTHKHLFSLFPQKSNLYLDFPNSRSEMERQWKDNMTFKGLCGGPSGSPEPPLCRWTEGRGPHNKRKIWKINQDLIVSDRYLCPEQGSDGRRVGAHAVAHAPARAHIHTNTHTISPSHTHTHTLIQ